MNINNIISINNIIINEKIVARHLIYLILFFHVITLFYFELIYFFDSVDSIKMKTEDKPFPLFCKIYRIFCSRSFRSIFNSLCLNFIDD